MAKYILAVCVLLLVGCTSISEIKQKDQFEKISRGYEKALRWGDWVAVSHVLDEKQQDQDDRDLEKLKPIKVTSYEVNERIVSEDQLRVQQVVEIQYYHSYRMVEKTLIDKQVWEYDEKGGWRLVSGLPKF